MTHGAADEKNKITMDVKELWSEDKIGLIWLEMWLQHLALLNMKINSAFP
jgi:hypothetical protein